MCEDTKIIIHEHIQALTDIFSKDPHLSLDTESIAVMSLWYHSQIIKLVSKISLKHQVKQPSGISLKRISLWPQHIQFSTRSQQQLSQGALHCKVTLKHVRQQDGLIKSRQKHVSICGGCQQQQCHCSYRDVQQRFGLLPPHDVSIERHMFDLPALSEQQVCSRSDGLDIRPRRGTDRSGSNCLIDACVGEESCWQWALCGDVTISLQPSVHQDDTGLSKTSPDMSDTSKFI